MKRHPALAPLSRDHQHALAAAQRLRRATPDTARAAAEAFLRFFDTEGRLHFRIEEEVLLPTYAAHGDPHDPTVIEVLVDHVEVRRDAAHVAAGAPLEALHRLGERLAAHIWLEEHELFPLVERKLPEPAIEALAARLREPAA